MNYLSVSKIFISITVMFLTCPVSGQNYLNEGAFFSRCYSHFTGEAADPFHPLLIDSITKNNHNNTIQNCMKIFDKGRLIPSKYAPLISGYPSGSALSNESDVESVKVLNYFFGFFQSFFQEKSFTHRPQTYSGVISSNWDVSEEALYLIRSTFEGSAVNVSGSYVSQFGIDKVLTSKESITGKRLFPLKNNHAVGTCNSYITNCSYSPTYLHRILNPQSWRYLPNWNWGGSMGTTGGSGPLTGIKVWSEGHNTYYAANGTPHSFPNMTRSHGAGAIGSTSYILKNAQYKGDADGGTFTRRRIVKYAFSSFLCREQPPLPMDDPVVLNRVNGYTTKNFDKSQTLAFRESVLCASCHVAYDEAAAVYRNTQVRNGGTGIDWNSDGYSYGGGQANKFGYDRMTNVSSNAVNNVSNLPPIHLINGSVSRPNTLQKANNVLDIKTYSTSLPTGRLLFTDYRGKKVDVYLPASNKGVPVRDAGIQELGLAMTSTDQYYACMTKRIFMHLTGVDISLENPFDTRVQNRAPEDEFYLSQYIEPLALSGNGLKSHKSIRRLIKEIISLNLYREVNLRGVAP